MKHNKSWIEYQNKLAEQRQERLNEKNKNCPPAKMNRETKRRYIKHYTAQGIPREEVERIIAMHSFGFNENSNNMNMAEINQKIASGEIPESAMDVLKEYF